MSMAPDRKEQFMTAYRIFDAAMSFIIPFIMVGVVSIKTDIAVFQTRFAAIEEKMEKLERADIEIKSEARTSIATEKSDRLSEISIVRADLNELKTEYYTEFPRNFYNKHNER